MFVLANAGLPMLMVVGPVLIVGFVPVWLLESAWLGRTLGGGFRRAIAPVLGANLLSTIVGIPLTWVALVVLQMMTQDIRRGDVGLTDVFLESAWLPPPRGPSEGGIPQLVPIAALFLCVPFYFASALIEGGVLRGTWRDITRRRFWSGVFRANAASYGLIVGFWLVMLLRSRTV